MPANELRRDPIVERWAVIAKGRSKRPDDYRVKRKVTRRKGVCFFCPGNEHTTPPEIDRIGDARGWRVRCFPNKFAAATKDRGKSFGGFYTQLPAYGSHEVIVETTRHSGDLSDLSIKRYLEVFEMINRRERALMKDKKTKYVTVFKNRGPEAGASLAHTHMQLISLPQVPRAVAEEAAAAWSKSSCPYCRLAEKEADSKRLIYENDGALAFTAFAGRNPFESWIMPKKHAKSLSSLDGDGLEHFADALKNTLLALDKGLGRPPYNFHLHASPRGRGLHFHIELVPKTRILAGFELGFEVYINVMPPEDAAAFLRSCI
jgi:UDPglucose--hexose-1-phosphate uridylyltransferase